MIFPGATKFNYTLNANELGAAQYLRLAATVNDSWGASTVIYSRPVSINQPLQGLLWIENKSAMLTTGATLNVVTLGLFDENGGRVINYTWRVNNTIQHTSSEPNWVISANIAANLQAGGTIEISATHRDEFGFETNVSTARQFNAAAPLQVEIHGSADFAPGNRYTAVLASPESTANGQKLLSSNQEAAIAFDYQWGFALPEVRAAADSKGNIVATTIENEFIPIHGETLRIYVMESDDIPDKGKLRVLVIREEANGLMVGGSDSLTGQNNYATGNLELEIAGFQPGAVARVQGEMHDRNVLVATLWKWQTASDYNFTQPIDLPGETAQSYTLQPAHFSPANYLRAIASGVDSTGQTTKITTAAQQVNHPASGGIKIIGESSDNSLITLRADLSEIHDSNGPVSLIKQRWESPNGTITVLLSGYIVNKENLNAVTYYAEIADALGFVTTLSANVNDIETASALISDLLPGLALDTTRNVQSAVFRHLDYSSTADSSFLSFNNQSIIDQNDISKLLSSNDNSDKINIKDIKTTAQHNNSSWAFWADKSWNKITSNENNWKHAGNSSTWLIGADKEFNNQKLGIALGREEIELKTDWQTANHSPGEFNQKLNIIIPYWEYKKNKHLAPSGDAGVWAGACQLHGC